MENDSIQFSQVEGSPSFAPPRTFQPTTDAFNCLVCQFLYNQVYQSQTSLCLGIHNLALRRMKTIPNLKTRRAETEIFAEILELCKHPTAKTRVIHKVNMSYTMSLRFLKYLQKSEMLKFDKNGKKFETTEKGCEYLKKYSELKKLLNHKKAS